MLNYLKQAYRNIKDNYLTPKHSEESKQNKSRIFSFFKSIINYFFNRYQPIELSPEQKQKFERGIGSKMADDYNISYGAGKIIFRKKDLTSMVGG